MLGRLARTAIALVVCLSAEAPFAAPFERAGWLRAAHCCASHCRSARAASTAARCCGVASRPAAPAAAGAVREVAPQSVSAAITTTVDLRGRSAGFAVAAGARDSRRAGPIFLVERSLRL